MNSNYGLNHYTITRPVEFNELAKYTKILDYVKAHRGKGFTRFELLYKSRYTTKKHLNEVIKRNTYKTMRGWCCNFFAIANAKDILHYDRKTRKWYAGENIDTVKY